MGPESVSDPKLLLNKGGTIAFLLQKNMLHQEALIVHIIKK